MFTEEGWGEARDGRAKHGEGVFCTGDRVKDAARRGRRRAGRPAMGVEDAPRVAAALEK